MRIHVLSDLHLEFDAWQPPHVSADVVVLAGDIHLHTRGIEWASDVFIARGQPVIYVPGNHEFYHSDYGNMRTKILNKGKECGVTVLMNNTVTLHDVRFLGSTLWTDFKLFGARTTDAAMNEAQMGMADFRYIQYRTAEVYNPAHSVQIHRAALQFLTKNLTLPCSKKTVVVTHHAPSIKSIHQRYAMNLMSAGFASSLDALVRHADVWIHGHTHNAVYYLLDPANHKGRVVCNPRGYRNEFTGFQEDLVIEV